MWFSQPRLLLHHFMRLAYEDGEDWLVEILEVERESVSAQLSFVYAVLEERKAGD
jgi:hypothetical protein